MTLKFRAWWFAEKKMITDITWVRLGKYRDLIGSIDGQTILPISFNKVDLMRSILLKDKNDKEIFEGDIVKDHEGVSYQVKYNKDFCATFLYPLEKPNEFMAIYPGIELEIIGNIYEKNQKEEK